MKMRYTFEELTKARDDEHRRIESIFGYLFNKNIDQSTNTVDYEKFFNDADELRVQLYKDLNP